MDIIINSVIFVTLTFVYAVFLHTFTTEPKYWRDLWCWLIMINVSGIYVASSILLIMLGA